MKTIKSLLQSVYASPLKAIFPIGISWEQGEFLASIVHRAKPREIIELGLGAGLSALWLESGLHKQNKHIVVDWYLRALSGYGKKLLQKSRLPNVRLVQLQPQRFLASELAKKTNSIDMFFVDVDIKFDSVMSDVYFVTKMASVGGVVIVRNMWNPSIRTAMSFFLKNLPFELYCGNKLENYVI